MALFTIEFQAATNADWEDNFELRDEAGAINLAGAAFEMDVRSAGGVQAIELTTAAGTLPVLSAADGIFGIKVLAATMATLTPGTYHLDCLMRQGGQTLRLFEGRLFLEKGITE
jgi:hypothetical protein